MKTKDCVSYEFIYMRVMNVRDKYFHEKKICWYRQVLCANSFTSLAELRLHRAGKPALNYLAAEHRGHVKATTRRKIFAIR